MMEKQTFTPVTFARQLRHFAMIGNQPPIMASKVCNQAAWNILLELYAQSEDLRELSGEDIARAIDVPLTQVLRVALPLRNTGLIIIYGGANAADIRIGLSDLGHAHVAAMLTGASAVFNGEKTSVVF